ncbi:acetate--CoA ligase family protein [Paraburkholderia phytofirmans]|uniref:acetate--CoA ligase family protein n=1 Tax=Paraburkholderia phytofirmans TaxID=261302 RepID=UPI0038BAFB52
MPLPVLPGGRIALISQSGATAGLLAQQAHRQNIGLSHVVALGNEAMIDLADVLDYAVEQPSVKAIALFAETIRRPERFLAVAERALQLRKPIVVLKVGSSPLTAEVAQAHTGALVGDDRVFNAVCAQYGLVRVDSLEQLLVTASVLAHLGPLEDKGFAAVSISGGACEVMADAGSAAGVRFARFAPATLERLKDVVADFGAAHNPLDITGAAMAKPEMLRQVLEILGRDPDVGLLGCTFDMPSSAQLTHGFSLAMLDNTLRGFASVKCPTILLEQTMKDTTDHARSLMTTHEVPFLSPGIDGTMRAIGHAYNWSSCLRRERRRASVPQTLSSERPTTERAALDYLSSHHVPVIPATVVHSAEEAFAAAQSMAAPVALKILSPDIFHKTEVGGVALDLRTPERAQQAYTQIIANVGSRAPNARVDGVIVSPMRTGGIELFVGVAKDPMFGKVLAVGLGGIWVEAMSDTALRLLPVEPEDVTEMLGELKARKILEGYRGAPAVDLGKLSAVISRIGNAALALAEDMVTLEVNPLYVQADTIEALDALVVWRDTH